MKRKGQSSAVFHTFRCGNINYDIKINTTLQECFIFLLPENGHVGQNLL